jgi:dTDP-4-amino-4,6-dideoxygalactose transaminase
MTAVSQRGEADLAARRAVGGEFALDPSAGGDLRDVDAWLDTLAVPPTRPRVLVGSGREAVRLVVATATPDAVVVPAFVCDALLQPLRETGCSPVTVDVDERGAPRAAALARAVDRVGPGGAVITVAPFGFPYPDDVLEVVRDASRRGRLVVEDRTHSLLSSFPLHADRGVASLRKWGPVSDGGLAFGGALPSPSASPDEAFASARFEALAAKFAWSTGARDDEEQVLAQLAAAEARLGPTREVHAMSAIGRETLTRLDVDAIVAARRRNSTVLLEGLRDVEGVAVLFEELPPDVCPFGFPVRVDDRDGLRAALAARRVFCPVHWPAPADVDLQANPGAADLDAHVLTIPCDQRYDERDMERVVAEVRGALGSVRESGRGRVPDERSARVGHHAVPARVLEIDDDGWDDEVRGQVLDPTCTRSFLRGAATARELRPVLVTLTASAWSATYPLLLAPLGGDRFLARTPEYGGPVLTIPSTAVSPLTVSAELRAALDETLPELGVVSEVVMLGPWLAHRDAIANTWCCRPDKTICVVALDDLGDRWNALSANMRRDISQARRRSVERWAPLDSSIASEFATRYEEHMERLDAAERWRLGPQYFAALARDDGLDAWIAEARDDQGGAACLVVRSGPVASYVYGTRWGRGGRATTLALWRAQEELAALGVGELLLGGGVGDADDDSLLRFKRRFAPREERLLLGARVFDRGAHDAAVREGRARPLPDGAVEC